MKQYKIKSNFNDLNDEEREILAAFMALGETELDKGMLRNTWLKHDAAKANALITGG
jgi:predicted ATPase